MGDEVRTLTEDEAYAIVADRVSKETADLNAKIATLTTENSDLQSKIDTLQASLDTEIAAKTAIEGEYAAFKTEVETAKEIADRTESRVAKVKEAASALADTFFTAERAERWAKMPEDVFEAHVKELAEVAGAKSESHRETAMAGQSVSTDEPKVSAAVTLLQSRRLGA